MADRDCSEKRPLTSREGGVSGFGRDVGRTGRKILSSYFGREREEGPSGKKSGETVRPLRPGPKRNGGLRCVRRVHACRQSSL